MTAFSLTGQTNAEIAADERKQTEAEKARQKADKAADDKAKVDAERDDFQLTGSDRPADVAGQGALFSERRAFGQEPGLFEKNPIEIVKAVSRAPFAGWKEATQWAKENLQGKTFRNSDTQWDIAFGAKGIRESFSFGSSPEQLEATRYLDLLIKRAVIAETMPDKKGRKEIVASHVLYAPLELNGDVFRVKIRVNTTHEDQSKFYGHLIESLEVETPDSRVVLDPAVKAGEARYPSGTMSIEQLLTGAKQEANGKPYSQVTPLFSESRAIPDTTLKGADWKRLMAVVAPEFDASPPGWPTTLIRLWPTVAR